MSEPLPVESLHHVAVVTGRLDESIAFYRDVLGFRPVERPDFSFRGAWLYAMGLQIHVIERNDIEPDTEGEIDTRATHLAFAVADDEAHSRITQQLKQRGIPFCRQVNAGGIPQLFFRDPDGHHIEIGVYPPTPPYTDIGSKRP